MHKMKEKKIGNKTQSDQVNNVPPCQIWSSLEDGKKKNTVSDIAGNRDVPSRVQVSGMFPYIAKRLKRGMFEWSL